MTMVNCFFSSMMRFLDLQGGQRIERGAGLVHQQDFRLVGDGAGDAKPLLLAAGQTEGGVVEAVLHLVPQRGGFQRPLDGFIEFGPFRTPGDAQAEDHVFVDRLRERIVFLEHHAHPLAQGNHLHGGIVETGPVDADVALVTDALDEVVHAVEVAQQGGFPAAGRTDQRGDLMLGNRPCRCRKSPASHRSGN